MILNTARKALEKYPLCDYCLGRLFAHLGYGLSNKERGIAIKTVLLLEASLNNMQVITSLARTGFTPAVKMLTEKLNQEPPKVDPCYICQGLLKEENFQKAASLILEKIREYEFDTFLVGCTIPEDYLRREEKVIASLGVTTAESLKRDLNREIGKIIQKETGKQVDFKDPDITAIVEIPSFEVKLEVKPLYIYGRYRKLKRGIPQSSGPMHVTAGVEGILSVEEVIGRPLLEMTQGACALLHAAGREDVDVRMLGNGRPFVIEIVKPKKRHIDLAEAAARINEYGKGVVEVSDLRYASRELISKLKALSQHTKKLYRAVVTFDTAISDEKLKKLEEEFSDITIRQRTPTRVLHRRSDRVRLKKVYEIKARKLADNIVEFTILGQGGLYIKELITGDNGRTKPNISEFLEARPLNIVLDVLEIEEPVGC